MADPSAPPSPSPPAPTPTVPATPVRGGTAGAVVAWGTFAALLALWAATGAGRTWRAPPAPFVATIAFLPYVYAAFAAWTFLAWSALPDRRVLPAVLAAIAASALALWGPGLGGAAPDGEAVRAMTWNVRRLWGPEDALGRPAERRAALRCVVEGVEAADPTVIGFLEVSAVDVADLSARLDLSCVHGDYTGADQDDLGGLAVCVRGDAWSIRSGGPRRFVDGEDWRYTFAEIAHGDVIVNVFAVHLQPYAFGASPRRPIAPAAWIELGRHGEEVTRAQVDQSAALLDRMGRLRDPTIVLGDFNSTRDTSLHVSLRRVLTDAWECCGRGFGPTVRFLGRVPLRVDYVYASAPFAVANAAVPARDCSDHRPVVADLVLAAQTR